MNLSKLIAKIASVLYLSASIGAFFGAHYYRKLADDLFSNAGLVYMTGFITAIIGFLIVSFHNIWTKNWTVLITVLGWLALAKGICLIAFPEFVHTLSDRIFTDWTSRSFHTLLFASDCCSLTSALCGPRLLTNDFSPAADRRDVWANGNEMSSNRSGSKFWTLTHTDWSVLLRS